MPSKQFPKSVLKEIIWEEELDGLKLISDDIVDNSRWSIHHEMVFQDIETQKFYLTSYSIGATESQDERPFEYEPDMISCYEVAPVETKIIVYKEVK